MLYHRLHLSFVEGLEFWISDSTSRFLGFTSANLVTNPSSPKFTDLKRSVLTANLDVYLRQCPTWQAVALEVKNKLVDDKKKKQSENVAGEWIYSGSGVSICTGG